MELSQSIFKILSGFQKLIHVFSNNEEINCKTFLHPNSFMCQCYRSCFMTVKGEDDVKNFVQKFVEHILENLFVNIKKGIFLVFVNLFLKRNQREGK